MLPCVGCVRGCQCICSRMCCGRKQKCPQDMVGMCSSEEGNREKSTCRREAGSHTHRPVAGENVNTVTLQRPRIWGSFGWKLDQNQDCSRIDLSWNPPNICRKKYLEKIQYVFLTNLSKVGKKNKLP